jgi:hypothetical protein
MTMHETSLPETEEARVAQIERRLARLQAQIEEIERRREDRWQHVMRRLLGLENRQISRGEVIGLFVLAVVIGFSSLIAVVATASRVCGLRV